MHVSGWHSSYFSAARDNARVDRPVTKRPAGKPPRPGTAKAAPPKPEPVTPAPEASERSAARPSARASAGSSPATARASAEGLPAAPAAQVTRIGIQAEPVAAAALLDNRHDFVLRGRVVSTDPIAEIALFCDGARVGQILLARTEAASPLKLPDGASAAQYNFAFHLPVPVAFGTERCAFSVVARTFDDQGTSAPFVLTVDPKKIRHGALTSGPTEAGASQTGLAPLSMMYVEHARITAGRHLRVQGWTATRDGLVAVRVLIGERQVGLAERGILRQDVARAHPEYPRARNAGFSLSVSIGELADTVQAVRVQAVTAAGSSHETVLPVEHESRPAVTPAEPPPAPPPPPQPQQPQPALQQPAAPAAPPAQPLPQQPTAPDPRRAMTMYCDEIALGTDGIVSVRGWAVSAAGIAGVSVLLDEQKVGDAELGFPRLDVGDAYPTIPAARHSGFRLYGQALPEAAGDHVITIIARNGLDDTRQHRQRVTAKYFARNTIAPKAARTAGAPWAGASRSFKFQLDHPARPYGRMTQPVRGRLTLEGWAIGRDGVAGIAVLLDGNPVGSVRYGLPRPEVGAGFADWPDALHSGFVFHFPPGSLREGEHAVALRVRGKDGTELEETVRITVAPASDQTEADRIRRRIPHAEAMLHADSLDRLDWRPRFRILVRDGDAGDPAPLARTLASLDAQVYPHWRVELLGDDAALREAAAGLIAEAVIATDRVSLLEPVSAASFATDETPGAVTFVAALRAGDELGRDALAEIALASGLSRHAQLLYADDIRDTPAGTARAAFFKPAFSPDLLLACNYIGRSWFARSDLLARAGATPHSLQQDGDYDLLLRCAEQAGPGGIKNVPLLLLDSAPNAADDAPREQRALAAAAKRRGIAATIAPGLVPGTQRLQRRVATKAKVSIIVATGGGQDFIKTCLETLKSRTAYGNVEIIAIDGMPAKRAKEKAWLRKAADKVMPVGDAFNWARTNNRAAAMSNGAFLLFLHDDTAPRDSDWLDALLEQAQRPEVGVVGPRLLYADGKVQHAGLFLGEAGMTRHAFRRAEADDPGYFGLALTQRNVMAVSGACMLMRRDTFDRLGGFDEAYDPLDSDVDFCLRAHEAGLLTVYTPYATLTHHEQGSRILADGAEARERFARRWRMRFADGDPYHSSNLSKRFDDFIPAEEPARPVIAGHPRFPATALHRILAVATGDLGDFLAALPAIRRLKTYFPDARISVLAGPLGARPRRVRQRDRRDHRGRCRRPARAARRADIGALRPGDRPARGP